MDAYRTPSREIGKLGGSPPRYRIAAALALLALVLGPAIAAPAGAEAAAFSWTSVAEETITALDEAAHHQAEGDVTQCKRAITRAYFGVFEEQKMEAAMRKMLGESHAFLVERQFTKLRRSAATATPDAFGAAVATLAAQLREDALQLDALGVPQEVYDVQ